MADANYRLVMANGKMRYAARVAAAMAQHLLGRGVFARIQAQGGSSARYAIVGAPRAMSRAAPINPRRASVRSVAAGRAAQERTHRLMVARPQLSNMKTAAVAVDQAIRVARAGGAGLRAKAIGASGMLIARPNLRTFIIAQNGLRELTRRVFSNVPATKVGARARLLVPHGPRLAARALTQSETTQRRVPVLAPGISAELRRHIAAPSSQHADALSFHRTVQQARKMATAGDVFLDKNLVGYHLAAAITAEQTRAAARPNISGSNFNSSMAALRPSGAGL